MRSIFSRESSSQLRLFLAIIAAIIIIIADSRFKAFVKIRFCIDTAVSPLYFLVNTPRKILDNTSYILLSRDKLVLENQLLHQELLIKNSDLLLLNQYKQENNKLRNLLSAPVFRNEKKMVTQVISVSTDPYVDQVIIDKGLKDKVYVGQPIIDDKGIIGQVTATGKFTSKVMLICNSSHALPIQVLRNNMRFIVFGKGCSRDLQIGSLSDDTDIHIGDILVTSGLGGRFPEGYPVAVVYSVKTDSRRAQVIITAHPTADLKRLRYLLLLWNAKSRSKPLSPNELCVIASKRLILKTS